MNIIKSSPVSTTDADVGVFGQLHFVFPADVNVNERHTCNRQEDPARSTMRKREVEHPRDFYTYYRTGDELPAHHRERKPKVTFSTTRKESCCLLPDCGETIKRLATSWCVKTISKLCTNGR